MNAPGLRYRALLVGNSFYTHLANLKGPEYEVEALRTVLSDPDCGLFRPSDVRCLYNCAAGELRRELGTFFHSSDHDDVLLFFFSGHGRNRRNQLYLCTEDTDGDLLVTTGVEADLITTLADDARTRRVVILLDCCDSGLYKAPAPDFTQLLGEGRYVLTSTFTAEASPDAQQGARVSEFVQHLVDALAGAAVGANGMVGFRNLERYVTTKVYADTKRRVGTSGEHTGDFPLARLGGSPPGPAAASKGGVPLGAASPVGQMQLFPWPATPATAEITSLIDGWAAEQPRLSSPVVREVLSVRPAHSVLLMFVSIAETRHEEPITTSVKMPLPKERYNGSIRDFPFPIRDEDLNLKKSDLDYRGWRRGTYEERPCEDCDEGRVVCRSCKGRGTVAVSAPSGNDSSKTKQPAGREELPDTTKRCSPCKGRGDVECQRCRGERRLHSYTEGIIIRRKIVDPFTIPTVARPNLKEFRLLGRPSALASFDLSNIPPTIANEIEAIRQREEQRFTEAGVRYRTLCALRTQVDVTFHDGDGVREARLVDVADQQTALLGPNWRVIVSGDDVQAMQRSRTRAERRKKLGWLRPGSLRNRSQRATEL